MKRERWSWSRFPVPSGWYPLRDGRDAAARFTVLVVLGAVIVGLLLLCRKLVTLLPPGDQPYATGAVIGFFAGWFLTGGSR